MSIAWALLSPCAAWAWSAPTDLSSPTHVDQGPAAAMNGHGDPAVAWFDQLDSYHSVIRVTTRHPGGSWTSDKTLGVSSDWQNSDPSVALEDTGDALVVWGATNSQSLSETRAAYAPAGHPFGPPVQIIGPQNGSVGDAYPFVAFDAAGGATAFWLQNDGLVY